MQTLGNRGSGRRVLSAVVAATLLGLTLVLTAGPGSPAGADTTCDALCTRVRTELRGFTDWLGANGVKGYIGEAGWPGSADSAAWNALADTWYRDADAAGLWVTQWATGEWWPNAMDLGSYINSVSEGAALDTQRPPATVVEAHGTNATYQRGVNVNGGEFGAPSWSATTSAFSNASAGTYDQAWHYDTQASFNYLASRGVKLVRLPFRWERIQPTLGGALNSAELQRLTDAINRAKAAGLTVIPTVFNYGGYMLFDGAKGVRRTIGTSALSNANFADLWSRLSQAWRTNTGVAGYGLMNEPANMTAAAGLTPPQTWERASQAAVDAIRATGDTRVILVPGYNFSGAQRWQATHPVKWITDGADNIRYEAHHYWDRDNSGAYANSYAAEVADAVARGFTSTTIPSTTVPSTTIPSTTIPPTTVPPTTVVPGRSITVNDVSVKEGKTATFTVRLSSAASTAVTVSYATVSGTALAGTDFVAATGSVSIAAGQTSATVAVRSIDDTLHEAAETFTLQLTAAVNATLADPTGAATIAASD
jgi:hypothetical protein